MLTHKNLVANLVQIQDAFRISEDDVLVGVLPFFHIYGQTVIMNQGLRSGATIVSMPRFDLDQFLDLIQEHEISQVYVVPPIALALAKHPAVDERDLSSVENVMSGAAPLGAELVRQGRGAPRLRRDPGLRNDGDEPRHAHRPPRRREPRRLDRPGARRHRVPDRRRRVRRGRGGRRARRALDPRPAGDGRLPQQRRGDRGDDRLGRLATHRRHRDCATRTASTSSSTGSRSSSSTRASRCRRPSSRRS